VAQVKVYALAPHLKAHRAQLSDTIHGCLVEALGLPAEKRFQRFFALEPEDFIFPADRSAKYTVLEIQLFEGRSVKAKKALIRLLFARFAAELGYGANDLEVNLLETPRASWGIRGLPGDELALPYEVKV
jgi:phenylpyruvate tautomerase PptA (4-oxalocrotonate tautomerase family)